MVELFQADVELFTHKKIGLRRSHELLTEIAAINGKVFLSIHQNFCEDVVVHSFLHQLDENGIPYQAHGPLSSDIAHFPEPVEDVTASNYDDIFRCSGE